MAETFDGAGVIEVDVNGRRVQRDVEIHDATIVWTDEQRKAAGAGDDVVRLSIGLEDAEDIIADLAQGLE